VILACRLMILKLYKMLAILEMQVLRIKVKCFKIKGLTLKGLEIKAGKRAGATAVLADISGDAPPEGRRKYPRRLPPRLKRRTKYPRRPPPRLKRGMWSAIG
jgi:hypothetical protein